MWRDRWIGILCILSQSCQIKDTDYELIHFAMNFCRNFFLYLFEPEIVKKIQRARHKFLFFTFTIAMESKR